MLDPSIIGATGAGLFMIGFFLLVDKIKGFPKGTSSIKDIPKGVLSNLLFKSISSFSNWSYPYVNWTYF
ncbi:hypothetical protein [Kroppenstedtia eburnea]|uniref:hypothetical protein n=1 Tax=Kroppenstedtia eburnea TaxID=714067 RepID=UPI00117A04D1|nr:hypothetical protein [Kroppenstedtia eburnea]QKI83359.1 hypothetical protein GXN75_15980 [Kroppenstedtia eburnea]